MPTGINDPGFPAGVIGDHIASVNGGFEPQRQNNWILQVSGIGQPGLGGIGGFGGVVSAFGNAIGGAVGFGIGGAVGGAVGTAISSITGALGTSAGGGGALELSLDSGSLPDVSVDEIELRYLNVKRYVAGAITYQQMPLVVKDFIDIGTATAIKAWHEQVANPKTNKVGLAKDYKKIGDLILCGPDGSFERTWRLFGVWPVSVNYGQLDMNQSDIVRINCVLRYDHAEAVGF